jgi:hypothetical protein
MKIEIAPTKKVTVLGVDKRSVEDLAWCATTYGINRLFWVEGHLLCVEVYEKSFEHEIENQEFPISQVCYASLPKYVKVYEVNKGMQIPVVNASDMKIFSNLIKTILKNEEK